MNGNDGRFRLSYAENVLGQLYSREALDAKPIAGRPGIPGGPLFVARQFLRAGPGAFARDSLFSPTQSQLELLRRGFWFGRPLKVAPFLAVKLLLERYGF
jgi:hypothetical protein